MLSKIKISIKNFLKKQKSNLKKKELKKYYVFETAILNHTIIGDYSYVNSYSIISGCNIGKFCSIGPHVVIGVGEHPYKFISTSPAFYLPQTDSSNHFAKELEYNGGGPVNIANDVWIGAGVYIKNGISIGNGAVIGAGSVVTKDIPDYAIVTGVPAKIIKYRFPQEIIEKLLQIKWWDFSEEKLGKIQKLIVSEDYNAFIENLEAD